MASFLAYSLSTGAIDRTGSVPDGDEAMQALDGEGVMLNPYGVTGITHYVALQTPTLNEPWDDGTLFQDDLGWDSIVTQVSAIPVLTPKQPMTTSIDNTYIAAGGSQSATIDDVPQGASLYVNDVYQARVDDGTVAFSAVAIGTYTLLLTHYRYLDQSYSVDVGLANLLLAIETEYAVDLRAPLAVAVEAETAVIAIQERINQLAAASESETAVVAGMSITANLDPASETEQTCGAGSSSDPAVETETAIDAVLSNEVELPEAIEVETAFDLAA